MNEKLIEEYQKQDQFNQGESFGKSELAQEIASLIENTDDYFNMDIKQAMKLLDEIYNAVRGL